MRRLASICTALAVAALSAPSATSQAQEPSSGAMAPRDDYSVFADAYHNPDAFGQNYGASQQALEGELWKNPRRLRFYGGTEVNTLRRSKGASNVTLTRTTLDIFRRSTLDGNLQGGMLDADMTSNGALYPDNFNSVDPNDPQLQLNVNEILIPNEPRLQTDQFNRAWRMGIRPKIGVELASGNRIEFSYSWYKDWSATGEDRLTDGDPLGTGPAFFMFQISDTGSPRFAHFFRFGYINGPFSTFDPRFRGEDARQHSLDPPDPPMDGPGPIAPGFLSLAPHYPPFENPPIFGPLHSGIMALGDPNGARSGDIPREPTHAIEETIDPTTGPLTAFRNFFDQDVHGSLLWRDGELAVADYNYDLQTADLLYRRKINRFRQRNWKMELLLGLKYVGMDEAFNFLFADSTFDRALANPFWANAGLGSNGSQPIGEYTATTFFSVDNDMYGPMVGLDATLPFLSHFEVDLMGKLGWVINSLQNQNSTFRGDGVILYDYSKSVTTTAGIFETKLGLAFLPHKNVRIQGGYEAMILTNVGTAIGNITPRLDEFRRPSHNDSVLFHGVYGGFEITF